MAAIIQMAHIVENRLDALRLRVGQAARAAYYSWLKLPRLQLHPRVAGLLAKRRSKCDIGPARDLADDEGFGSVE